MGSRQKPQDPGQPKPKPEDAAPESASSLDERAVWVRALLVLLPAAAGVPLVVSGGFVLRTLGAALCLLAATALLSEVARALRAAEGAPWTVRGRPVDHLLLPVAIFIVASALLAPCLLGMMPQSQDHPVHLARAWHFLTQMLANGQLSGWSDLWFAGWPAGEDYPPLGDWWISLVYLATFGLLGWEAAYALAFLGVFAGAGLAVYHFGKTYFGRVAGTCAALFYLLDRGQYREGGWNYTVWWGVWPQIVSTAFTLLSLSTLDRVLTRGRSRDFVLTGLCVAFALLSHPVAIIYFGLAVPIYLTCRALGSAERPGPMVARTIAVFVLGAALAAFWLLPFSAKSAWMAKYGELWKSLPNMADGLWRGNIFENTPPPVIWLGILGGALAAWRRSFAGLFVVGFGAVVLFVASSTAFQELNLISISPAFGQIQFQRLSIPAKVCFLLLAGLAIQVAFARASVGVFTWRRYALTGLVLLSVSPFVEPVLRDWGRTFGSSVGQPKTRTKFPAWAGYQEFLSWSRELKQKADAKGEPPFRIAYVRPYNNHFFAAAPVYNGIPAYKVGFTPCTNFIHKPDTADPELYRLLQVKYVVALGPQSSPDLTLERSFGQVRVYRNGRYSPQRYTLLGPGSVNVETFDRERVRLRVSGAGPDSRLVLHRANYPNWKATVDGEPLTVETASLGKHSFFIGMPAKNGTIDVRYTWPAVNVVGSVLSWLAIAVLLLVAACRFRPALREKVRERLLPWALRAERNGLLLAAGLMVVVAVLISLRGASRATSPADAHSLLNAFDQASAELERAGGAKTPCTRNAQRLQCSDQSWNHVGIVSHRIDGQFRRCLWAHPVDSAKLRVRFPRVKLGRALSGHHGLLDDAVRSFPRGAPVTLEVSIEGAPPKTFVRPNVKGWAHFSVDTSSLSGRSAAVSFTVSTSSSGGRHYCFDASVEP